MGNEAQTVRICLEGGSAEITEKKSRFLADVYPVRESAEAEAFLQSVKKKYHDASHHCYAYVTGEDGREEKCSDDGEPSGTAGRPILEVIRGNGLLNVCIVVTRYFGGTLLGTGGLLRAYQRAAAEGLRNAVTGERKTGFLTEWNLDYDLYGKAEYAARQRKPDHTAAEFGSSVHFSVLLPETETEVLIKEVTELSAGRALPAAKTKISYCMAGGKAVYL